MQKIVENTQVTEFPLSEIKLVLVTWNKIRLKIEVFVLFRVPSVTRSTFDKYIMM